jgi:hypothetical protein
VESNSPRSKGEFEVLRMHGEVLRQVETSHTLPYFHIKEKTKPSYHKRENKAKLSSLGNEYQLRD